MSILLSIIPYVAGIAVFCTNSRELFKATQPADGWAWKLAAPVLVASLTPMAAAGARTLPSGPRAALAACATIGVLCIVVLMSLVRQSSYFWLLTPVSIFGHIGLEIRGKSRVLLKRHLVVLAAVALITTCAAVNLWTSIYP